MVHHFQKLQTVYVFLVALAFFSKLDFIRATKQVVGVLSFFLLPSIRERNNETIAF